MANYKLVDVKAIQSNEPRSRFVESELEELANLFLTSGILVEPLVVKETSPHSYNVLHGHKVYYGAVRAKEKDPRKAEMVNAFVIDRKDGADVEEAILKQISEPSQPITKESSITFQPAIEDSSTQIRLGNLETRINQQQ